MRQTSALFQYAATAAISAAITAAGLLLRSTLNQTDLAMLPLLGVVLIATRYGRGPAVAASLYGILVYDFLFVPPYFTLDVADKSYFITFGVMLVVALTLANLTATIRDHAEDAEQRARQSEAVVAMADEMGPSPTRETILAIATDHISRVGGGAATIVLTDGLEFDEGLPRWPEIPALQDIATRLAATWSWVSQQPAGSGTSHASDAEGLIVPLSVAAHKLGIVVLVPAPDERMATPVECAMVSTLAERTGLALGLARREAEQHA